MDYVVKTQETMRINIAAVMRGNEQEIIDLIVNPFGFVRLVDIENIIMRRAGLSLKYQRLHDDDVKSWLLSLPLPSSGQQFVIDKDKPIWVKKEYVEIFGSGVNLNSVEIHDVYQFTVIEEMYPLDMFWHGLGDSINFWYQIADDGEAIIVQSNYSPPRLVNPNAWRAQDKYQYHPARHEYDIRFIGNTSYRENEPSIDLPWTNDVFYVEKNSPTGLYHKYNAHLDKLPSAFRKSIVHFDLDLSVDGIYYDVGYRYGYFHIDTEIARWRLYGACTFTVFVKNGQYRVFRGGANDIQIWNDPRLPNPKVSVNGYQLQDDEIFDACLHAHSKQIYPKVIKPDASGKTTIWQKNQPSCKDPIYIDEFLDGDPIPALPALADDDELYFNFRHINPHRHEPYQSSQHWMTFVVEYGKIKDM